MLHRSINVARKLLGDSRGRTRGARDAGAIQTVHGRGYRFVAPVSEYAAPAQTEAGPGASFVGREAVLRELRAALDEAVAGRSQAVLLIGEPGIGKSRSVEELARDAGARGARTVTGTCHEGEGAPAFWPWVQMLRSLLGTEDEAGAAAILDAAGAAERVPEIRERVRELGGGALSPEQERFRVFEGVRAFLERQASAPLLLVLEDLHWADTSSLQLLQFLVRELRSAPVLLVATLREAERRRGDPVTRTLAELSRHDRFRRIELAGLSEEEVGDFLAATIGRRPPEPLVRAVCERTDGNPFFIHEVVRWLSGEGLLEFPEFVSTWSVEIPPGVREVLGRRLESLSEACNDVLSLGAVIGREFGLELMLPSSGSRREEVLAALDEATAARVIAPVPGTQGDHAFSHALVREALYDELPTARRVGLHRRVGESLEKLAAEHPEPYLSGLAHHFHAAAAGGDEDKAIKYAVAAAARAAGVHAHEEAAQHYARAVELLELRPPVNPEQLLRLLQALGDAHLAAGEGDASRESFLRAAEVARSLGQPDSFARCALGYSGWGEWGPPNEPLRQLLEEALAHMGSRPCPLRARILSHLAGVPPYAQTPEQCRRLSSEALEIARDGEDAQTLSDALMARHFSLSDPDETEERISVARELLSLSEEVGRPDLAYRVRQDLEADLLTLDRIEEFSSVLDESTRLAETWRTPLFHFANGVSRAGLLLIRGRLDDCERLVGENFRLGQRLSHRLAMATLMGHGYLLLRHRGQVERLEDALPSIEENFPWFGTYLQISPAVASAEADRRDSARDAFERVAANDFADIPRSMDWLVCVSELASVAAYLGDRRRAGRLLELLAPYAGRHAVLPGPLLYAGPVDRHLGALAATLGKREAAAAHFENALAMCERLGAAPERVRTRVDYARCLLASRGGTARGRGRELAQQAHAEATKLGLEGLAATADGLGQIPVTPRSR